MIAHQRTRSTGPAPMESAAQATSPADVRANEPLTAAAKAVPPPVLPTRLTAKIAYGASPLQRSGMRTNRGRCPLSSSLPQICDPLWLGATKFVAEAQK